jgi:hypothetical protein
MNEAGGMALFIKKRGHILRKLNLVTGEKMILPGGFYGF